MTLAGLKGKVVVLAPFLTLCQDECPLITAAFIGLQRNREIAIADEFADLTRPAVGQIAVTRQAPHA